MNDVILVCSVDREVSKDGANVRQLTINWSLVAAGTVYDIAGAVQLDRVLASDVASVTSSHNAFGKGSFPSNGLEAGVAQATIPFFNNTNELLDNSNTWKGRPASVPAQQTTTVVFTQPVDASTVLESALNYFVAVKGRSNEIHLPGYAMTSLGTIPTGAGLMPSNLYKFYSNSPDQKQDNFMMWALMIPGEFNYPAERNDIRDTYKFFSAWANAGGNAHAAWYDEEANSELVF